MPFVTPNDDYTCAHAHFQPWGLRPVLRHPLYKRTNQATPFGILATKVLSECKIADIVSLIDFAKEEFDTTIEKQLSDFLNKKWKQLIDYENSNCCYIVLQRHEHENRYQIVSLADKIENETNLTNPMLGSPVDARQLKRHRQMIPIWRDQQAAQRFAKSLTHVSISYRVLPCLCKPNTPTDFGLPSIDCASAVATSAPTITLNNNLKSDFPAVKSVLDVNSSNPGISNDIEVESISRQNRATLAELDGENQEDTDQEPAKKITVSKSDNPSKETDDCITERHTPGDDSETRNAGDKIDEGPGFVDRCEIENVYTRPGDGIVVKMGGDDPNRLAIERTAISRAMGPPPLWPAELAICIEAAAKFVAENPCDHFVVKYSEIASGLAEDMKHTDEDGVSNLQQAALGLLKIVLPDHPRLAGNPADVKTDSDEVRPRKIPPNEPYYHPNEPHNHRGMKFIFVLSCFFLLQDRDIILSLPRILEVGFKSLSPFGKMVGITIFGGLVCRVMGGRLKHIARVLEILLDTAYFALKIFLNKKFWYTLLWVGLIAGFSYFGNILYIVVFDYPSSIFARVSLVAILIVGCYLGFYIGWLLNGDYSSSRRDDDDYEAAKVVIYSISLAIGVLVALGIYWFFYQIAMHRSPVKEEVEPVPSIKSYRKPLNDILKE